MPKTFASFQQDDVHRITVKGIYSKTNTFCAEAPLNTSFQSVCYKLLLSSLCNVRTHADLPENCLQMSPNILQSVMRQTEAERKAEQVFGSVRTQMRCKSRPPERRRWPEHSFTQITQIKRICRRLCCSSAGLWHRPHATVPTSHRGIQTGLLHKRWRIEPQILLQPVGSICLLESHGDAVCIYSHYFILIL